MRTAAVALVASLGFVATAGKAAAADLPVVRKAAPAVAPASSWTGFYVGGHAGYGWGHSDVPIQVIDPLGLATNAIADGAFPLRYSFDRSGYVAGGQIGYNYQIGRFLWGVEADISASGIDGEQQILTPRCPNFCGSPNLSNTSQDMDWFGTARVRFGGVVNNWLFYGTAGVAFGEVKYSYWQNNAVFGLGGLLNTFGADTKTHVGWTAGAGLEYGFGRWSVKAEYLYFDLGDHSFLVPHNTAPTLIQYSPKFENRGSIVRAGLNYRFTGTALP